MFKDTKKFVINLKRRPDRLESVMKEFAYMGMNVEVFDAIDTNSHVGCTLSHQEIIKTAIQNNWEQVIVFEDDIMFMPYAKSLSIDLEESVKNLSYGALNFNPAFHCPVNLSTVSDLLIDLTKRPPREENHRGVYGAGFMIYHKTIYEELLKCTNLHPMDQFIDLFIYPKYQSYAPAIPIACSTNGESDVSHVWFNTYYTQVYNWILYCPKKLPVDYWNQNFVENLRRNGDLDYKTLLP